MELNRCSRCGAFYVGENDICSKCSSQDTLEFSTFKSYIEENGCSSIDTIATQTGISTKNVNRFIAHEGIELSGDNNETLTNSGVVLN